MMDVWECTVGNVCECKSAGELLVHGSVQLKMCVSVSVWVGELWVYGTVGLRMCLGGCVGVSVGGCKCRWMNA